MSSQKEIKDSVNKLSTNERSAVIVRTSIIGIVVNVILAAFKGSDRYTK